MTERNYILYGVVIFLLLFSIVRVQSYVWNLGEPRKVLYLAPGESAERYVLTMNNNNVSLNVSLFVNGDLAENIKLLNDSEFILQPNEEKRVYYKITAQNEINTTETRINVKYTPPKGNGMILPAIVIVTTSEEYRNNTAGVTGDVVNDGKGLQGSQFLVIFIILFILLVFVFLVIYSVNSRKKRVGRAREN